MLGINIGSLSTTVSVGQKHQSALLFKTELLLSETSARTCPSLLSFGATHRVIGDQASLVLRKNIKSSFQYINRFIGFDSKSPFSSNELKNYYYIGDKYIPDKNEFTYERALKKDKRNFCQYYCFFLKISHVVLSVFCNCEDYNLFTIKLGLLLMTFPINLTFNIFFFTNKNIKSTYIKTIRIINKNTFPSFFN